MNESIHKLDEQIGECIRDWRIRAKMTQAELAQKVGLATITIRQYETGKREPKFETLKKIAVALNCEITMLVPTRRENPLFYQKIESNLSEEEKSYLKGIDEEDRIFTIEEMNSYLDGISDKDFELWERMYNAFYELTGKGREIAAQMLEALAKMPDYKRDFSN